MNYIYISIIILLVVIIITPKTRRAAVGICNVALGQSRRKEERKQEILKLLQERGELSNFDIREVLKVTDRTVVRYIDEMEKEDKIKQVGVTGRGVVYRLKS